MYAGQKEHTKKKKRKKERKKERKNKHINQENYKFGRSHIFARLSITKKIRKNGNKQHDTKWKISNSLKQLKQSFLQNNFISADGINMKNN